MKLFNAIGFLLGAFTLAITGCQPGKIDSTQLSANVTKGESEVTYTVFPGKLVGMPENAIAFPSVPGKDMSFESFYPDGTPQFRLKTDRSNVLETLIGAGGIANLDAQKLLAEQQAREFYGEQINTMMDRFERMIPLIGGSRGGDPNSSKSNSKMDRLLQLLESSQLEGLLGNLNKNKPTGE